MAKHLTTEQLELWHQQTTREYPLFIEGSFLEYFNRSDTPLHRDFSTATPEQLTSYWEAKFTFVLLVLAAEEELHGYPMEAITADEVAA